MRTSRFKAFAVFIILTVVSFSFLVQPVSAQKRGSKVSDLIALEMTESVHQDLIFIPNLSALRKFTRDEACQAAQGSFLNSIQELTQLLNTINSGLSAGHGNQDMLINQASLLAASIATQAEKLKKACAGGNTVASCLQIQGLVLHYMMIVHQQLQKLIQSMPIEEVYGAYLGSPLAQMVILVSSHLDYAYMLLCKS